MSERPPHHLNLRIPPELYELIVLSRGADPTEPTTTSWILEACRQRLVSDGTTLLRRQEQSIASPPPGTLK